METTETNIKICFTDSMEDKWQQTKQQLTFMNRLKTTDVCPAFCMFISVYKQLNLKDFEHNQNIVNPNEHFSIFFIHLAN